MSASRSILAGAGLAAGVTTLIVVLAVMGGLQKGYIDAILEISSFHARAEVPLAAAGDAAKAIRSLPEVSSVLVFSETTAVAMNPAGALSTVTLRAVDPGAAGEDPSLVRALSPSGAFPAPGGVVLGKEVAATLGLNQGDRVELFGVTQSQGEGLVPVSVVLPLGGTFTSGYYEIDASGAYVCSGLSVAGLFSGGSAILGVKFRDRWDDYRAKLAIEKLLPPGSSRVLTWREYNRSFFGALRTEKTLMLILVSLVFLVVGINVFHAMRRVIVSKTQDIAAMKAFGVSERSIRSLFVLEGLAVGIAGAGLGTILGLAIAGNIDAVAGALATLLKLFSDLAASLGLGRRGGDYRLFSPAYYYLRSVPSSIGATEVCIVAFLAAASTTLSAAAASKRVSQARPSEVLRNE